MWEAIKINKGWGHHEVADMVCAQMNDKHATAYATIFATEDMVIAIMFVPKDPNAE